MHHGLPITCHCHPYWLATHTILLLHLLLPVYYALSSHVAVLLGLLTLKCWELLTE